MSGIKQFSQIDMRVRPTQDTHVVRWIDMIDFVNALTTAPVRVVMTDLFVGTYNNADLTLTATIAETLEIDGIDNLVVGDRILLAGQQDKTQNGIYTLTVEPVDGVTEAVLTRADDFDESFKVKNGLIIPVSEGDDNSGSRWKTILSSIPFVLGSTNIEFLKEVVDITKVVQKAFLIQGDDVTSVFSFSHGWNTMNITHEIFDEDGNTVIAEFKRTSANDVDVIFGNPLENGVELALVIRAEAVPV